MTNLDHLYQGVRMSGDKKVEEQWDRLSGALYDLDRQHPDPVTGEFVQVRAEMLNELLHAYRDMTA
jgi:hypothetical protein